LLSNSKSNKCACLHQWKRCAGVHGTKSDTTVSKLFFWQDTVSCSSYLKVLFIIPISSNLFLESWTLHGSQSLLLSYTWKHRQPWPSLESIFNILFYYLYVLAPPSRPSDLSNINKELWNVIFLKILKGDSDLIIIGKFATII